jgi:hypothetical protein
LADNNKDVVSPEDMLGELLADNQRLTGFLRATHEICGRHKKDVASTSMIEVNRPDRAKSMVPRGDCRANVAMPQGQNQRWRRPFPVRASELRALQKFERVSCRASSEN